MAASEHTLTLKAVLDTNDVEAKMQQLNNAAGGSGGGKAKSGLLALSQALKTLKLVVANAAIAKAISKIAEKFGIAKEAIDKTQKSINNIATAAATGSPIVFGLVTALELLNGVMETTTTHVDELEKNLKDIEQVQADASNQYKDYNLDRSTQLNMKAAQKDPAKAAVLLEMYRDYAAKNKERIEELTQHGSGSVSAQGLDAERLKLELKTRVKDLRRYDQLIDQLESVVQKAAQDKLEAEVADLDRQDKLEAARKAWAQAEEDYNAQRRDSLAYFQQVMAQAKLDMENAYDEADFQKASSRLSWARSNADRIIDARDAEEAKKPKEKMADFASLMQTLAGTAVSNFSAAGFGMGEQMDLTSTIENQLNEVIRLMQEQLRKDLTVTNSSYTL